MLDVGGVACCGNIRFGVFAMGLTPPIIILKVLLKKVNEKTILIGFLYT